LTETFDSSRVRRGEKEKTGPISGGGRAIAREEGGNCIALAEPLSKRKTKEKGRLADRIEASPKGGRRS